MSEIRKAPSVKHILDLEKEKEKKQEMIRKQEDDRRKNDQEKYYNENAKLIIDKLEEMFKENKVSSVVGCTLSGIPSGMLTDGIIRIINTYLDNEWVTTVKHNTGSIHDDDISNTLIVKPKK